MARRKCDQREVAACRGSIIIQHCRKGVHGSGLGRRRRERIIGSGFSGPALPQAKNDIEAFFIFRHIGGVEVHTRHLKEIYHVMDIGLTEVDFGNLDALHLEANTIPLRSRLINKCHSSRRVGGHDLPCFT